LDAIRIALANPLPCPWVDRAMIQELFGVGARSAQSILRGMGGHLVGGALMVEREQALRWIETRSADPSVRSELHRVARLESSLDAARRQWQGRRVIVQTPAPAPDAGFDGLPGSIDLRPGQLHITFSNAQELLERLVHLSQAILNDFTRFERLAGQTSEHLNV
jgi:hypothetical protein